MNLIEFYEPRDRLTEADVKVGQHFSPEANLREIRVITDVQEPWFAFEFCTPIVSKAGISVRVLQVSDVSWIGYRKVEVSYALR